jgi:diacylglycerol O-acyltransferase
MNMNMFIQTWGSGEPIIALHPLALESTVFAGVGALLGAEGFRTLAADMPGFGQTPAGDEPLTPARLAAPVIELARSLESPPIVLGFSLGARVALEAALTEPSAFRGLALVAPYLPWTTNRWGHSVGHLLSPSLAERLPLQVAWPLLKVLSASLDRSGRLEHDWLARASVRVGYYLSCPATRRHVVSATRALMLDPPFGPQGMWTRLPDLRVPAVFLWAGHDRLVPATHPKNVAKRLPAAPQLVASCCGHFANGRHFRCYDAAMALAVRRVIEVGESKEAQPFAQSSAPVEMERCPCLLDVTRTITRSTNGDDEDSAREPTAPPRSSRSAEQTEARAHSGGAIMRRLSGEDSVFVYGETANMPMHTIGTMILDPSTAPGGSFDYARVVRTLAARIHLMPPYRQRLLEVPFGLERPVLVDDPAFRVENHIERVSVTPPGTLRELAQLVGQIAGRPLDRSRPLWEMWYVEGLENGRIALITKMHHCMLDGASGANQMASLLDLAPDAADPEPPGDWRPPPLPSRMRLAAKALIPSAPRPTAMASLLVKTATSFWQQIATRLEQRSVLQAMTAVASGAPRTQFTSAITPNRSVAYASASLADIKRVKNAFGVTVNDVVLAACALALRSYLCDRDDLPSEPMRCAVPISMKSDEEKREFSNKVAVMTVNLPTRLDDPEKLLQAIHDETEIAKKEFAGGQTNVLADWLDVIWPTALGIGARLFSASRLADWLPSWANLIVSNMAGPPVPLYFAGAQVLAIYPMGPIGEGTGLNITVLSNMDRVDVGLLACRDTVPDLWSIADGFEGAVRDLMHAAQQREVAYA